jgi:hypothetical protein
MNRGLISVVIVLGFVAAAGGATYYFTDKYGTPDDLVAKVLPAGFGAPASPAVEGPPPPPPPSAPVNAAAGGETDVGAVLTTFDYKTQKLVWVLPPGIHAEGPFLAHVTITSNGKVTHESEFPLVAATEEAGLASSFPAGSNVVRLSMDDSWPAKRDKLMTLVNQLKGAAPGANELEIASDFKTKIDDNYRRQYCMQGDKIVVDLYVEEGQSTLKKIDISGALPILQRTILTGGCHA